jgi:hypothetical protein
MKTTSVENSPPFTAHPFGLKIRPLYSRVHKSYHPEPHTVHTLTDYLILTSLLSFQLHCAPPAGIFHSGVPNMRVTCSAPPILPHITAQPISGADYKLWTFYSRAILFNPPVTILCLPKHCPQHPAVKHRVGLCSSPNIFCTNRPTCTLTLQHIRSS